ncbi:hypothetical protein [Streptomyces eurythermus]|uniref:hypothetical protein n=1 Tax=Streptomyces eurythermus TaxID=42237 RepID=UPI0033EED2C5
MAQPSDERESPRHDEEQQQDQGQEAARTRQPRPGTKGVEETGLVGPAAAIGNAVSHATGRRIHSLPITIGQLMH